MKDGEIVLDPSWGGGKGGAGAEERNGDQEGGEDEEVEEVPGDDL